MILIYLLSALVVVVIAVFAGNLMLSSAKLVGENAQHRLVASAVAVSLIVTEDELNAFMTVDDMYKDAAHTEYTDDYMKLKQRLKDFAEEAGLMFAFFMRLTDDNKMQFIIDSEDPYTGPTGLEVEAVAREYTPDIALSGTAAAVPIGSYSPGWDGVISAFAPVHTSGSEIRLIAGVDLGDESIIQANRNSVIQITILIVAIVTVVASGMVGFILYKNKAKLSVDASQAKSSFLSRMSHEMRTPMNAIVGLCRMAKESNDMTAIKGYLDNIGVSSSHLRQVIDDVLDLSKIESGKVEFQITSVDLFEEIDKVKKIIAPQAEAKKQHFSVVIAENVPKFISCDAAYVRQIAVNLLSNAVKFTPDGGELSLTVVLMEMKGSSCNLVWKVKDSGIGIDEKKSESLFAPFEQGDGSTSRKYGGTGLGLTISQQLVEMMGGHIEVQSILGVGSEFTYNIWVEMASEKTDEGDIAVLKEVDLTDMHVLLVEDSEINQMIAQDMFENMGAKVDVAADGREAVNMYENSPGKYSIIFMDIQMPVMDGYEATRKIRASGLPNAKYIPIIAMTANVFKEDIAEAMKSGMNGHIGKPFEVEQVVSAIVKAVPGLAR